MTRIVSIFDKKLRVSMMSVSMMSVSMMSVRMTYISHTVHVMLTER